MRKLFECCESDRDFIEVTKLSEDKIELVFNPLLDIEYRSIVVLNFNDCKELIKELNFLMDKLG